MLIVLWEKRFFFVAVKNNQNTRSWPKMHFSLDETNVWRQDSAWEACDDPHHEGDDEEELCTFTLWYQPSLSWPQVCSSTCSSRSMWSLGLTEISGYWRRPWDGGGGHVISINQGLLFLLWGRSPRSSSRLAKRHWMHERPGMKWNLHPMVMQGERW